MLFNRALEAHGKERLMRIPFAIDPTETWTVDLIEEVKRYEIALWRKIASAARAEASAATTDVDRAAANEKLQTAEVALATAETDLAAYARGSGPQFVLGYLIGGKRDEIAGMAMDATKLGTEAERRAARAAWHAEVVRWTVRGHANLRNAKGAELPFQGQSATLYGETTLTQPTGRQLETYAPFLSDLATIALHLHDKATRAARGEDELEAA